MKTTRRLDLVWLGLLLGTAATWWLGESGRAGPGPVLFMLGVAAAKGGLVIREFMALRGVKPGWQLAVGGWLLVVLAVNLAVYGKGV